MRCDRIQMAIFLSLAVALASLCISCQDKSVRVVYTDKCLIDISVTAGTQTCPGLSKMKDERIVWKNSSTTGTYVCADPTNDPFDGYGWYILPEPDRRGSGKIRDAINPGQTFDFYPSLTPCGGPSSTEGTRSVPKIIILP